MKLNDFKIGMEVQLSNGNFTRIKEIHFNEGETVFFLDNGKTRYYGSYGITWRVKGDDWVVGKTDLANEVFKKARFEDLEEGMEVEIYWGSIKRGEGFIQQLDQHDELVYLNDEWINFKSRKRSFKIIDQKETRHIKPKDYELLLDVALTVKDAQWFSELHEKVYGGGSYQNSKH